MFTNPPPQALRALLKDAKTIAVVGISPRPERPSHRIAARLLEWGYRVIPVRPAISEVLGLKAYASLSEVPERSSMNASRSSCPPCGCRKAWSTSRPRRARWPPA